MFTKNSPQGRFVNGTLGIVLGWSADDSPIVKTKDDLKITTEKMEWQLEEQGKVRASVAQYPLRLAYAMTVHKSQGSEYPCVILVMHPTHYPMLQRNLLYTALTRAKRLLVVVGTKKALAIATRNDAIRRRFSRLAERVTLFGAARQAVLDSVEANALG